jgi:hypothetical protein
MRTFPEALGSFRKKVEERAQSLRQKAFAELEELSRKAGVEKVTVESCPAAIAIIYLQLPVAT